MYEVINKLKNMQIISRVDYDFKSNGDAIVYINTRDSFVENSSESLIQLWDLLKSQSFFKYVVTSEE